MRNSSYLRLKDRVALIAVCIAGLACVLLLIYLSDINTARVPQTFDQILTGRQQDWGGGRYNDGTARRTYGRRPQYVYDTPRREPHMATFDPNTADSTRLLDLGLSPYDVRRIYRYRNRGGVFSRPEDFLRVLNPTKKFARQLMPYIRISDDYQRLHDYNDYRDTIARPVKFAAGVTTELNNLDTTQLKKVPGIGSYTAKRIADYGHRLGGYRSIAQLDELELNIPEESRHYLRLDTTNVKRINVNTATVTEMSRHPYIGYFRAKTIADYRKLHKRIVNIDQLRTARDFGDEARTRIKPYITY